MRLGRLEASWGGVQVVQKILVSENVSGPVLKFEGRAWSGRVCARSRVAEACMRTQTRGRCVCAHADAWSGVRTQTRGRGVCAHADAWKCIRTQTRVRACARRRVVGSGVRTQTRGRGVYAHADAWSRRVCARRRVVGRVRAYKGRVSAHALSLALSSCVRRLTRKTQCGSAQMLIGHHL